MEVRKKWLDPDEYRASIAKEGNGAVEEENAKVVVVGAGAGGMTYSDASYKLNVTVTEQGMAKGSQMGSDLMGTTGDQMNPETGNGTAFQGFITGDDRLGIRFGTIGYADFCAAGILDQPGTALGLLRLHDPPDQADIILFQFTLTKNILQDIQGFRCLRKKAEAAGFIIQTMTGGRGESIRITAPDIFPAEIREGNTAAGIRFHTDAGALVDKQYVIILIDNRKGRNGCIISGNRIRQIDLQAAAFRQPVIP